MLIEKFNDREEVCDYATGLFKVVKRNYPSIHKETLAIKKTVNNFMFYLKPVNLMIRIDINITQGILKNEALMEKNSSFMLKWFVWV